MLPVQLNYLFTWISFWQRPSKEFVKELKVSHAAMIFPSLLKIFYLTDLNVEVKFVLSHPHATYALHGMRIAGVFTVEHRQRGMKVSSTVSEEILFIFFSVFWCSNPTS